MTMKRNLVLIAVLVSGVVLAAEQAPRQIAPATVTMQFPTALGDMQRPAVEFDHKAHTEALKAEGCETCHRIDAKGELMPKMASKRYVDNRDDLIDAYHGVCIGCHRDRSDKHLKAGPLACIQAASSGFNENVVTMSVLPSPSQSPVTGMSSETPPQPKEITPAQPSSVPVFRYQR